MIEQDVIGHLIDVERLASDLLLDAQTEADKRRKAAKDAADLEYQTAYAKIISEMESSYESEKQKTDSEKEASFKSYQSDLEKIPQNYQDFTAFLNSLFPGN
ncbi:hypothetical protein K7I13_03355 [Brucepastera parasyntrophica]|uniref:hypothetical protein n=1 Tax=Brucepastera parasyntrophica TaxID=2880008 RepID=UPI00210DA5DF|nr:hypothetical protein [Brucepastera parasyntrophica]ULQ60359.1 hypothetical protein K7I13_03355 [Brucepastera parasyntrophica]